MNFLILRSLKPQLATPEISQSATPLRRLATAALLIPFIAASIACGQSPGAPARGNNSRSSTIPPRANDRGTTDRAYRSAPAYDSTIPQRRTDRISTSSNRRFTEEERTNIRVYQQANQSVVNINTSTVQYDRFFLLPVPGEGSGSGSVLDKQGHILTNNHVIEDAREIEVTLASGNSYPGTLVGTDEETDIAIVKIDAPANELVPLPMGRSDDLLVGQRVYALGNPFGLSGTLTTGIISSLNRTAPGGDEQRSLTSLIQTDAAMNPGNSGGPLLDTSGTMIGMNIAIASTTGQNAGVGFAIPANRLRRIVPALIENGRVVRPSHGIITVKEIEGGLKIVRLQEGGPAERAGLRGYRIIRKRRRQGPIIIENEVIDRDSDIIVSVEGRPIRKSNEFLDVIEQYLPGDTVTFTILREGSRVDVPIRLTGN